MKKNVIAVAVAAALVAPVAMAEVSISGTAQAELISVGGDGAMAKGLYITDGVNAISQNSNNAGRIDFKASEDLGDGMKAIAHYGLNMAAGSDNLKVREALVGLSAGWGTVLAGRMNHPYKTSTVGWDPLASTFMAARNGMGMAHGLYGSEVDNALAYTNTFGTAKVALAMIIDESADATDATKTNGKNAISASVNMPVGPVEVAVAYVDASEYGNVQDFLGTSFAGIAIPAAAAAKNTTATKVGVKWTSGDFSVAGQVEMLDKGLDLGDGEDKGNVMYINGTYTMGNNMVVAAYGNTDKKLLSEDKTGTYLALALIHNFSKTTSAHVGYRASNYGSDNADVNAFGAGLRVKF